MSGFSDIDFMSLNSDEVQELVDKYENLFSVGGTAFGSLSIEEIKTALALYMPLLRESEDINLALQRVSNAMSTRLSTLADPSKSTKYQADFKVSNLVGGALSVDPLFGRFIVANTSNEQTNGTFRADGKNSHMFSSSMSTTLGSTTIDTTSGYDLNFLSDALPSSVITPVKTWMMKLFPILTDKRLIYIALVEGLLVLIGKYLENNQQQTLSTQIEQADIATIIVDNQELENQIIAQATA